MVTERHTIITWMKESSNRFPSKTSVSYCADKSIQIPCTNRQPMNTTFLLRVLIFDYITKTADTSNLYFINVHKTEYPSWYGD